VRLTIILLVCVLSCGSAAWAQSSSETLPRSARLILNRKFPGWKFAEVSPEVQQFFKTALKGASPVVISGDFDGNGKLDYAALIHRGYLYNSQGQAIEPRNYLVVFLRRTTHYKIHVIKNPAGEYIGLARKGTSDYNYNEQKEITYATDAIFTGILEKGGCSYVYKKGRFISFVSSD
jgi:hypothetical protein